MKTTTANRSNGLQWTLTQQLDDLEFANNIALLSHSYTQMPDKSKILSEASKTAGFVTNKKKTKVNCNTNTKISMDGSNIEEVKSFTYLGSMVDTKGRTDLDVDINMS